MSIKDAEDVRMTPVECVSEEDVKPVLHVIPPALDRVHRCSRTPELPRPGHMLIVRRVSVILPLHHVHGLHDGLDVIRVEEIAPERQTDAEEQQGPGSEEEISHDSPQHGQHAHALLRHAH